MTLCISHLSDATLFTTWTKRDSRQIRAASGNVRTRMKHNPCLALFLYKSERGLLHELHRPYQKRDTISSPSIAACLRTAPSA